MKIKWTSDSALARVDGDTLTLTMVAIDPEGLRRQLNEGFCLYRHIELDLSWLGRLPMGLLEVLSSAEMKARLLGARLSVLCSEACFAALRRMGWTEDCLHLSYEVAQPIQPGPTPVWSL